MGLFNTGEGGRRQIGIEGFNLSVMGNKERAEILMLWRGEIKQKEEGR